MNENQKKVRYIFTLLGILFFIEVQSQVKISPEPIWIVKEELNNKEDTSAKGLLGGVHVLLCTEQVNIEKEEYFFKGAYKAVDYNGIQNISSISADFDPTYQQLHFHEIEVIRNGHRTNRLKQNDIQTARRETNAESFIYDGSLSAFVNIPDVRIGDIVSFSYSIKGFNPVHNKKYSSSFTLNSNHPIDRIAIHIFSKNELEYQLLNTDLKPVISLSKNVRRYSWVTQDIKGLMYEELTPSWHIPHATVLVTEYRSWSEVIKWGEKLFTFKEHLSEEVKEIVESIKKENKKEGDRIKAALQFAQNEIRYLALHSGIGGYKPNPPNKVINQRFGDCKDKSVLLAAILNEMGIKAHPTLVNTALRQMTPNLLPSSKIFDHCIVKVVDKNESVLWLDPTMTNQEGTYNKIYLPNYQYGLVLDHTLKSFDTISNFNNNLVETFNTLKLTEMGKGGELEIKSHYHDGEADYMRTIFRNSSKEMLEKELMRFQSEIFGRIAPIAPLTVVDDSVQNKFSLLERYKLDSIWRTSNENSEKLNLSLAPMSITSQLTMPSELNRNNPFALVYPMVRKEHFKVILPERIHVIPESETINSDFFYFDFNSKYNKFSNELDITFYYKNQVDHVPTEKFDTFYDDMVTLNQNMGYLIYMDKSDTGTPFLFTDNLSFKVFGYDLGAVAALLLLAGGIVFLLKRNKFL